MALMFGAGGRSRTATPEGNGFSEELVLNKFFEKVQALEKVRQDYQFHHTRIIFL